VISHPSTPLDPRREPMPCPICRRGCGCTHTDPGCGHYGCYGRNADRSCPGVPAEEARYAEALRVQRLRDAATISRRARLEAMYAQLASTLA
jgi:hypothetical protein